MGKAQSKRSVDITTENKDGAAVAEGEAGKVGKIEEIDQKPQLNGDANKEAAADSGVSYGFISVYFSHLLRTNIRKVCQIHDKFGKRGSLFAQKMLKYDGINLKDSVVLII